MQLHAYIDQIRTQLVAAASLGDENTRRTADALAAAAEPALRLAVLAAVSAAADEITAALLDSPAAPTVSAHLDEDEIRLEVRPGTPTPAEPAADSAEDGEASARISLRLSEALKTDIEAAARTGGTSVNGWLVRAATQALASGRARRDGGAVRGTHRVTGWVNG